MSFDLERLFCDVFAPVREDAVTIMFDLPGDATPDRPEWAERRAMAADWHAEIGAFAARHGFRLNPLCTYRATGVWAADLPRYGMQDGCEVLIEEVARQSSIIISMPQFSATPALVALTERFPGLRAASMPLVSRAMEQTALAADYARIARTCAALAVRFDAAVAVDVRFSTGHRCSFDLSDGKPARQDNGMLHPGKMGQRMCNLPSGEVYVVPREDSESRTEGEIPLAVGEETAVLTVARNRITGVSAGGPAGAVLREAFAAEPAMANIAEVAIGCNERAVVSGNILEDEKAGFHWAYGRSDFLGGVVGPGDFSAPQRVTHRDIVYARQSRIGCQALDFVQKDGTRVPGIRDGEVLV